MKTLCHVSIAVYSLVLLLCAFLIAEAGIFRKRESSKSEIGPWIRILTAVCAAAVSVCYIIAWKPLSGDYVIHMAFAISPLFMHRLAGLKGGYSAIPPVAVLCLVAAAAAVRFVFGVSWDSGGAALLLLSVLLILIVGRVIWRYSGTMRKFDGALSAKETLDELADIFHLMILLFLGAVGKLAANRPCWGSAAGSFVCLLLMGGLVWALYVRRRYNRVFVLCRGREDVFMDNFRLYTGFSRRDSAKMKGSCENLFMRLNEYFEENKPYLDPELTMADIAKILLTNKMYLSRTVNECTGRNFCQFVNYYRVRHAVELFRGNSSYKIADLTKLSGFNSVRSFMMAFRLYMNVSPSQWCRSNRSKYAVDSDADLSGPGNRDDDGE